MDIKIIFAIASGVTAFLAFLPYLKDIFAKRTKPHAYTWLIWAITQATAVAGLWYGGGGLGSIGLIIGVLFVCIIFLLSFKYGTKNITTSDTIVLIAALTAVVIWWQLHSPLIAVIMVSVIDFLGYIPSFRKSFFEPWSETVVAWLGFILSNIFALLALNEYNLLTLTYIVTLTAANSILAAICMIRRTTIAKPQ